MRHLKRFAEPVTVSISIQYQSAKINPVEFLSPEKAPLIITYINDTRKLQPEY